MWPRVAMQLVEMVRPSLRNRARLGAGLLLDLGTVATASPRPQGPAVSRAFCRARRAVALFPADPLEACRLLHWSTQVARAASTSEFPKRGPAESLGPPVPLT